MTVDIYTKIVLTVIGACLIINVVRNTPFMERALAQSGTVHVVVDGSSSYSLQYAGPMHMICDSGCR